MDTTTATNRISRNPSTCEHGYGIAIAICPAAGCIANGDEADAENAASTADQQAEDAAYESVTRGLARFGLPGPRRSVFALGYLQQAIEDPSVTIEEIRAVSRGIERALSE